MVVEDIAGLVFRFSALEDTMVQCGVEGSRNMLSWRGWKGHLLQRAARGARNIVSG